jgi:DNA-binding NtrC family response regulator
MDAPQILLVDDDPATLQGLSRMLPLHMQGLKVDLAASAFDALERMQRCDYDAIVSDIMMPGLNGLELLARVKLLRPTTPTLLITGSLEPALLQRAMSAGAYDFIQKPIDRLLLVGALKRAIQSHQLQQQVQRQQSLLKDYARFVGPLAEGNVPAERGLQPTRRSATPFQPPSWLL